MMVKGGWREGGSSASYIDVWAYLLLHHAFSQSVSSFHYSFLVPQQYVFT